MVPMEGSSIGVMEVYKNYLSGKQTPKVYLIDKKNFEAFGKGW